MYIAYNKKYNAMLPFNGVLQCTHNRELLTCWEGACSGVPYACMHLYSTCHEEKENSTKDRGSWRPDTSGRVWRYCVESRYSRLGSHLSFFLDATVTSGREVSSGKDE